MATITQHAPGTFCWPELATSDAGGAKAFYAAVFGWTFNDTPMGEAGVYTTLRQGERSAGALYPQGKDQAGVPPHWGAYVAVANADEAAAKAEGLGARQLMAPFDVMDLGRMAVLQDPQGAIFSVWEARKHIGATVLDEPGALCWTELMTPDVSGARSFYTGLFGWAPEDMAMGPMTYTVFKLGDKSKAGMMSLTPEMGPMPPHWLSYFAVKDSDATVAKAIMAGATVIVPPTDIPAVGRFAVLQDPQGAVFGILGATPPA
ncbi:MAG TPA: VOC family protein [Candidatus Eisenbacteria bacterium]